MAGTVYGGQVSEQFQSGVRRSHDVPQSIGCHYFSIQELRLRIPVMLTNQSSNVTN